MLVRLARWLRVLGFDCELRPELDDHALVEIATTEDRILLTRDRHLVEHLRPVQHLLIPQDRPLHQLRHVIERLALPAPQPDALFTRCLVCNTSLVLAPPEHTTPGAHAHPAAPPLRRCPGCERIYWAGSHTRRMRAALARELPDLFA
jgi:uncharacterized protein